MYRALKLEQELDVEKYNNYDRLVHDSRRREENFLALICKMSSLREIASQNLQKVCRENAVRKAKVEELESKNAQLEASHIQRVKELESIIAQLKASHVERVKEQNDEIDGLNQEITDLRAQIPATKDPCKRALSSETEQTRPVEDTHKFINCDSGQVPIIKNPRKRALSSETDQTRQFKGALEFRHFDTSEMIITKRPRKRASSSKQNSLDRLKSR